MNWAYKLAHDVTYSTGHTIPEPLDFHDTNKGKLRLQISTDGLITIKAGYAWDGCSPKFNIFDLFLIGTPDGVLAPPPSSVVSPLPPADLQAEREGEQQSGNPVNPVDPACQAVASEARRLVKMRLVPKTYHASLLHDTLYQFLDDPNMPLTRKQIDQLFLKLMTETKFKLRWLYYLAVRAVGGIYHALMKVVG